MNHSSFEPILKATLTFFHISIEEKWNLRRTNSPINVVHLQLQLHVNFSANFVAIQFSMLTKLTLTFIQVFCSFLSYAYVMCIFMTQTRVNSALAEIILITSANKTVQIKLQIRRKESIIPCRTQSYFVQVFNFFCVQRFDV